MADYVSYFVRGGSNTASRAVSQVEALNQSRCKRMSGDAMTCTTCHDPHRSLCSDRAQRPQYALCAPDAPERVAFYRSKCLGCHTQAKYTTAHFPATPDCTQCHMPKSAPTDIPHEQWTDHRILRTRDAPSFEPAPGTSDELVPVPGIKQHPSERDLALGYYNLVSDGDLSQSARARMLLQNVLRSTPNDLEVLKALGVLAQLQNDRSHAIQFYQSALDRDPIDYTAALNLGVLLARSGQLKRAADLWQGAFARNEDITELGMNLASVRCMLGDKAAAEEVLRRVLLYNPDHRRAREELKAACPAR
jgi:hypothetical protein